MNPALLDRDALAAYLGISPKSVDRWRRDPSFPRPLARILRWRLTDIDAWLADQPLAANQFPTGATPIRARRSKHDRTTAA